MMNRFWFISFGVLASTVAQTDLSFADNLGSSSENLAMYLNDPALSAVTREFGQTVIRMKRLPYRSKLAEAHHKPWSSWYFPKKEDFMFRGSTSPLAKYDLFRRNRYHERGKHGPPSAAEYDKNSFNARALSWEGLCDAWSLAAISRPEPKRPVTLRVGRDTVTFSVADLKALLLRTYEAVDDSQLKYYGQKFTGTAKGWIFPDIFPNEFHRFLEVHLFKNKQAFVMDHDPGPEVWNVPVFKANYNLDPVPDNPNAVEVTTWVYSAEVIHPHTEIKPPMKTFMDYVGTREASRTYHYILHGERNEEGNLVVKHGEWIKGKDGIDSTASHPDFITVIPNPLNIVRKSSNPEIEIDLVDEILQGSY
jgi:hypothetical protein